MTRCVNVNDDRSADVSHEPDGVVRGRDDVGPVVQALTITRGRLRGELRHCVDEAHTFNEFTESLDRCDAVPALLGFEQDSCWFTLARASD